MRRIVLMLVLLFSMNGLAYTQKYSEINFIPPINIPLKLSGSFGELRSNHFHSGIDIKTGEMEGLSVFSIADGYISRIKIQSGGYGKALYITHPSGFVSVYAHLSKYKSEFEEYVIQRQYEQNSYEINIFPNRDLFPVKQGEIIAYTGNSGRSGGPHLHFEIRDEKTQKPINPLLFNFLVTDKKPPKINLLKIYPSGDRSTIEYSLQAKNYFTVFNGKNYAIKGPDTIHVSGTVYFGINTYDPFNRGLNKNGVFSIQLYVDNILFYGHKLETFSFAETRYINSLIDYKEYKLNRRRVQKSCIEPNNKLSFYTVKKDGKLTVESGRKYKITYKITDIERNKSELIFWIRGTERPSKTTHKSMTGNTQLLTYHQKNTFITNDLEFHIPGKALYDTLTFFYSKQKARTGAYSDVHRLHFDYTPLHSWCRLAVKPDALPEELQGKALLVKLEGNGKISSVGGGI